MASYNNIEFKQRMQPVIAWRAMKKLLAETGFEDVEFRYTYRGNGYFRFFTPAYIVVSTFENLFRALGWNAFCAGMLVTASKKG